PVSGTKAELRYIVEEAAKEKIFSIARLQECVAGLEPYSHRHVYFLKVPKDYLSELSSRDGLREVLKTTKHSALLRSAPPFQIPGFLKPECVELEGNILRIKFIAPALTSIRRPKQDRRDQHSNLVFRVYEE